uniref:C-type lectin domain-containing protein n=1 Tax=Biomphalaria glabrata TaxID=6526 RepID=A0A2C9KWU2_BIOGL
MALGSVSFLLLGTFMTLVASDIQVVLDSSKVIFQQALLNKLYYASKDTLQNFDKASEFCTTNGGGYPAEVNSLEEMQVLENLVKNVTDLRVFIAGTDAKSQLTWVFQRTQVKMSVFDWIPGEPNDKTGYEDCIELKSTTNYQGRMNDIPCGTALKVLCERDLF